LPSNLPESSTDDYSDELTLAEQAISREVSGKSGKSGKGIPANPRRGKGCRERKVTPLGRRFHWRSLSAERVVGLCLMNYKIYSQNLPRNRI
jgi:hypothetical protein